MAVFAQHFTIVQSQGYLKGVEVAQSSTEIQRVLGKPVRSYGFAVGEVRRGFGTEFTEWSVPLDGPKGRGHLYGVANRLGDSWDYSRLAFLSGDGQTTVDLTPPPRRDSLKRADQVSRVYLVPMDSAAAKMIDWAPRYYQQKLGLDVIILPPISMDSSVIDQKRKQVVAEQAIDAMRKARPDISSDPSAVLIGIMSQDMYIRGYDWDYATNLRLRRFAVISTARLQPFADLGRWNRRLLFLLLVEKWNPELIRSRIQKLLSKNVYALSFDLPLSNDWTSLLGSGVRTGADVDWMGSEIIGAEKRWDSFVAYGDPDVSVVTEEGNPPVWRFDTAGDPPDTSSESFITDLKIGLFTERKTDFIFKDDFPLTFSRAYRNLDDHIRPFGIGTNDTLDIFLIGVMGSYIDLILDDGARLHYERDRSAKFAGQQVYRLSGGSDASTLIYEGNTWRLTNEDGSTYFFPYIPNAWGQQVTVLTGFLDPQGHRFEMRRDAAGDLLGLQTPSGKWLKFVHDSEHRITRAADSSGRTLDYQYDPRGRLSRVSESDGHSESYQYNERNELISVFDSNGQPIITNIYSPDGFVIRQTLSDRRSFMYSYEGSGRPRTRSVVTDPEGYVTHFDFTPDGYHRSLPERPALAVKR